MEGKNKVAKYLLTAVCGFIAVLFFSVSEAKAAAKLALFSFEYAENLEIVKGSELDLASGHKYSAWASSNSKVVKVTKKGAATAVKTGKAVISAKIDGKKVKCAVKVVKDIVKESSYINDLCKKWKNNDNGKSITIKKGKIMDGLNKLMLLEPTYDDGQTVAYKKCSKITAVEKNASNTSIYFNAQGVLGGKQSSKYACVASINDGYMILQAPYVFEGKQMYGAGTYWYEKK